MRRSIARPTGRWVRRMLGFVLLAVLAAPATSPPAMAFLDCGVLETNTFGGGECLLFHGGGSLYWLDNYGGFGEGDTVLVLGTRNVPPMVLCGTQRPGIGVELIQACRGFDFGCGTLAYDEDACWYFHSWRYGDFLLGDWGGFQVGDTVRVYGGVWDALTWCVGRGDIFADSVVACPDSLTGVSATTWGAVKALYRDATR